MTIEQAIHVLTAATASLSATRDQHAQILAALQVVKDLAKSSDAKPKE